MNIRIPTARMTENALMEANAIQIPINAYVRLDILGNVANWMSMNACCER